MKTLIKLFNYITTHNLCFVDTKKGKGMCSYKLEQVASHREAIENMASACGWQLTYFNGIDKDTGRQTSSPNYFLGPKVSVTPMSEKDMIAKYGNQS